MKRYRIKGSTEIVKASCPKQAIKKLVIGNDDCNYTYKNHYYTHSNRKSWCEVETDYGYKCIIEEV